jgi:hypothetical protein
MEWTYIRLTAHILLIGWTTAVAFLLILARGKTVQIVHVPVAIVGLTLFSMWIVGLVATMKSTGAIPREAIIPLLAILELGASISAWGWLLLSARYSFRFSLRRHANGY